MFYLGKMKIVFILIFTSIVFSQELIAQESASTLLQKAQTQAQKENKAIFVKFEASWCGWCHKMTADMKAPTTKEFFEKNFVTIPLVVFESPSKKNLENPGALELLKSYKAESAGLTFWAILDANGKVVTTAFYSGRTNLGGPSTLGEVRVFIRKLRKVLPKVSKEDKEAILKQFVKDD